jgi:tetratricopeptide (TPR) repeat protein
MVFQICKCPKNSHEHVNYEYVEFEKEIEDEKVKEEQLAVQAKLNVKQYILGIIQIRKNQLEKEQKIVNKYAARFAAYITSYSIVLNNKSHEEYMDMMIANAKDTAERTGDYRIVKGLEEALQQYKDQKEYFEQQLRRSNKNSGKIKLSVKDINKAWEEIDEAQKELFKMKYHGPMIREILDTELAHPMFKHIDSIQQRIKRNQFKNKKTKRPMKILKNVAIKSVKMILDASA